MPDGRRHVKLRSARVRRCAAIRNLEVPRERAQLNVRLAWVNSRQSAIGRRGARDNQRWNIMFQFPREIFFHRVKG